MGDKSREPSANGHHNSMIDPPDDRVRPTSAPMDMTEEEAVAAGMPEWAGISHEQMNVVGQPARPEYARALGIPLTTFAEWTREALRDSSRG
ncbi:hypothetical protein HNR22_000522 [Micromonospora jinlongensis]|uniref:Uncharacterized protein n=1 Tax=Micromonospora jinlongensis TaxID=1287877 RepID=A0A7Z0BCH0_9ACTN|nr:hypothetical protein [Micromonospora jinlongensis]NYH40795.1 hypothetical protein [Micromonospora jinlongensis]